MGLNSSLRLVHEMPTARTMQMENIFPFNLRLTLKSKSELLPHCEKAWLVLAEMVIGEVYGAQATKIFDDLHDDIPDLANTPDTCYLYSIGIVPHYQGAGYGRMLLAHWLGLCHGKYKFAIWHATSNGMHGLSRAFGALTIGKQANWCDTGETATAYRLTLR